MIGISERGKLGTWRLLRACEMLDGKAYLDGITILYSSESRGTVQRKSKPKGEDACVDFEEASKEKKTKKNP